MSVTRRSFLAQTAVAVAAGAAAAQANEQLPIVDTHQHLWDLNRFRLPWLADAPEVLRRSYSTADYAEATRRLNVQQPIYMEVDVDPSQKLAEARYIAGLKRDPGVTPVAAVVGGDPAGDGFVNYVKEIKALGRTIKGVRQVLHNPSSPQGYCLREAFVRGVRLLGAQGLSFDLCMRPTELRDALRLTDECPDTRFILDHCGNADVRVFRRGAEQAAHNPDQWRRDIEALARRPNLVCKISGSIARAPRGWTADDLAPVVNQCLDAFGPDRVVFGGVWPVCLLGATYRQWVEALRQIVASRPQADRRKLWADNARRLYQLA
jgi:L-fuconolactonase